jgi:hypothetical protein
LLESGDVTLDRYKGRNVFLSGFSVAARRTSAANTYLAANGYLDISNQRNYNGNTAADFNAAVSPLHIKEPYANNLNWIFILGTIGIFSGTDFNYLESVSYKSVIIGTQAGTYATVAQPRTTAKPTLSVMPLTAHVNCPYVLDAQGTYTLPHAVSITNGAKTGTVIPFPGSAILASWQPNHAYVSNTNLTNNPFISPSTENGFIYQCTTDGVSDGSEPTWPTTIGNTVTDGSVVWTCAGTTFLQAEVGGGGRREYWNDGVREWTAATAPSIGAHKVGDRVRFQGPTAGGFIGAVCVSDGAPGTWKTYGAISA